MILLLAPVQGKTGQISPYPAALISAGDFQPKKSKRTEEQVPPHTPDRVGLDINSTSFTSMRINTYFIVG